jgi:type 1 glutamine amidotransferase
MVLLGAANAHAQTRVLVFSKTAAARHESIPQGLVAVAQIAAANGLTVDISEDAAVFTTANLERYAAVVWLSTSGDVLTAAQQNAFERYIHFGGGYAGIHAADTERDWPWYGELIGSWASSDPAVEQATVDVADRAHPSTRDLPASWTRTDAFPTSARDPSVSSHVLATVRGQPISWCRAFEGGRSWYTGMGHSADAFAEPDFRKHLAGGILWAAGLAEGDCHVEPQPCAPGSDEFDDPELACRWTIVRPNPAAYALDGGALNITTEQTSNLFLQRAPAGDYELTAKITFNASSGGQQAALLIYQDDGAFFKVARTADDDGRWLETGDAQGTIDRRRLTGDYPATFWLRLTQVAGTVVASASPDGMNWAPIGRPGDVSAFSAPRIGLTALTRDDDFVTTVAFHSFELTGAGVGEDRTPPTIVATPHGLRTSAGEYLNHATVALEATDLGSGIERVEYAIGDGPFTPYTTPVTTTATLRYRAADNAGNVSEVGDVAIAEPPDCAPRSPAPGFTALYDGTIESLRDWSFTGSGGVEPDGCAIASWGGAGRLRYDGRLEPPCTLRVESRSEPGGEWTVTETAGSVSVPTDGRVALRSIQVRCEAEPAPIAHEDPPSTLALELASPALALPAMAPGVARDYEASVGATVTSSLAGATLTVRDAGSGTGRLANAEAELATPLRIRADGAAPTPLSGTPATLLRLPDPVAHRPVTIAVSQSVGVHETLRSGIYQKPVTFTLAAGTP